MCHFLRQWQREVARDEAGVGGTRVVMQVRGGGAWKNVEQACLLDPGSRRKVTFCSTAC